MGLRDEILEQPDVAARLLRHSAQAVQRAAEAISGYAPAYVLIAARGTSDNAAIYAQYALGVHARLPVALAVPSVTSLYGVTPRFGRALVIGVSQSGASPDIVGVVRAAREEGALTLALTNTPGSDLARAAEHVLDLAAGPERAVAATKTYTATLVTIAMFTAALAGGADGPGGGTALGGSLADLPEALGRALATEVEARAIAIDQVAFDRCVVLGRGYHYATAREWALKLKELSYVLADPYSAADFMHGPLALIEPGFLTLAVVPEGATRAGMEDVLQRVGGELGARLLVISDSPEVRAHGEWSLAIPAGLPEWLVPLVAIVPGQLHALHLAVARGLDPDAPRSIGKVTRTR